MLTSPRVDLGRHGPDNPPDDCRGEAFPAPCAVLVHDEPAQRQFLSGLLSSEGLEVLSFESADAALSALERGRVPSVVVTELCLPDIDGWRFCHLLRSPEYGAVNHVPILAVSAAFFAEDAARLVASLGANAFLPSPVGRGRFTDTVRALLRGDQPVHSPRVLIVEDSRTLCSLLREAFEASGYGVDTVATVAEASHAFEQTHYDVALLDYHLPDGSGDRLLGSFRRERPDCVCLMMTTDTAPELAFGWLRQGAAAYLRKPFEPQYLLEVCARSRREHALLRTQALLEERTRSLRKSEARQRAMLDEFPDPVFSFTEQGRYLYVNEAFAQGVNKKVDQIVGRTLWDVFPAEEAERRFRALRAVVESGEQSTIEIQVPRGGGARHYITTIIPTKDSEGNIVGVTCSAKDVTSWKQAEEEREKLQEQLSQAGKIEAVGRLAGGIAHDFNNMLGVILGHADLALAKAPLDPSLSADLREIQKAAQRSAVLTGQLLAFARKQTVAPKVLDLNETVDGTLSLLKRLLGEGVELVWRPKAAPAQVKIDPSQLDQVLANLCVNARDAIQGVGTLTIETSLALFDDDYCSRHAGAVAGQYVCLVVSDNGCGMDKATLDRVFEPFFTTKEEGRGTGLGLATVYGIVKQNRGFINVYSEPTQGTTFKIYLPRQAAAVERVTLRRPDGVAPRGHETVLLVEDEPSILVLGQRVLEGQGYKVLAADRPAEALRLARECGDELHLLMTDVIMPEMNGRELAKQLTTLHPNLKCLFMSGYTADVIAHHGVLNDGVHFLQKPFSIRGLAAKVREVLEGRPAEAVGAEAGFEP